MKKNIFLKISLFPSLLIVGTGCSVFMAASGSTTPDLSILEPGTSRKVIEQTLGKPLRQRRLKWENEATYQFFTNDEPNYGRATSYAFLAGMTMGLSEVVTAPLEAVQGDRHEITITYNRFNRLKKYRHETYKAPLPPPGHVPKKEPGTFGKMNYDGRDD
jgi:hypothetical protein